MGPLKWMAAGPIWLQDEFKIFEFVAVNVTTLHANGDGNDCNGNGNGDNVTTA